VCPEVTFVVSNTDGGGDRSVAPSATLLAGYLTGLLCRNAALSSTGRTLNALQVGLGDEGIGKLPSLSIPITLI
jgi:hypothetical protein